MKLTLKMLSPENQLFEVAEDILLSAGNRALCAMVSMRSYPGALGRIEPQRTNTW